MTDKNIEIENRILKAKTTDELLALAAEMGEPLTIEQAEKILAETAAQRQTAAQSFAAEEDIPDAALEAVAGGSEDPMKIGLYDFTELTSRDGDNVYIYFSSTAYRCQYWACGNDWGTQINIDPHSYEMGCARCRLMVRCRDCAYRYVQSGFGGSFYHDHCNNPDIRRHYGL